MSRDSVPSPNTATDKAGDIYITMTLVYSSFIEI